jgi:type II secretory pathway pseudopilin PulG
MRTPRSGFTIVETLVAIIVLSFGVLALASSVGGITRMMSNGQRKTRATSIATSVLDSLRNKAYSSIPKCTGLVNGSTTGTLLYGDNYTTTWTVASTNSGTSRQIVVRVAYRVGTRAAGDTLVATINPPCP